MIDPKELRIGNLFEVYDNLFNRVDAISAEKIRFKNSKGTFYIAPENINPIPLTPEILERCGFEDTSGGYRATGSEVVFSKLINQSVKIDLWEQWPTGYSLPYYGNKLESLHQLQNLYFALTGEELEIKELQHT